MKKKLGKRLVTFALSLVVASTVFVGASFSAAAYTQTTGVVSTDNVKVRSSASTTASQVSSLKKGDKIDIVDESTDSSGYVWYKIFVNKSEYGYVRSDLVTKSGDSAPKTSTSTNSSTQTENKAAPELPATTVTATEQKSATVTSESVNVRGGAGTAYDSVGKVTKGENVTITGEASDKDGKTWYQVTFGANGKTGFVRSDLVAVSEAAPAEGGDSAAPAEGGEAENAEAAEGGEAEAASESEQSQNTVSDAGDGTYSLLYTPDDEGTNTWYLYDNVEGYRVKVKKLIEAAQGTEAVGKLSAANKKYKTVVVILALLCAALAVAVVLLILKLRDAMYYEDEEEEEEYDRYSTKKRPAREEEPEEERPVRRRERTVRPEEPEEESYASSRVADRRAARDDRDDRAARRPAQDSGSYRRNNDERTVRPERNAEDARPSRRAPEPEKPSKNAAPKRKTRNFIGDDDDFEFEFLDLDDDK